MAKPADISLGIPSLLKEEPQVFRGLIAARLSLIALIAAYFVWLPSAPTLLDKQTVFWILATYSAFQAANWWMYLQNPESDRRNQIEAWIDILFASGALLVDSGDFPFTILLMLGLLLANAVQHGQKTFLELISGAAILTFLSAFIRQLLLDKSIYLPFIGGLIFLFVSVYYISVILRRNEQLKELAARIGETDSLTGMLNQQAFIRSANYLITLAQRSPMPMVLLIAEIENFHNLNDKHGQQTGDLILKHFSRITLINLRRNDLAARYTGNTFVFLITNVNKKAAEMVAMRLQHEFALWADREKLDSSISFAMTTVPDYKITIQILLKHVGKYLYLSKRKKGVPGVAHAPPLTGEDIIRLSPSTSP